MIICFEITYGRYLKDSMVMFKEVDENDKVFIPQEQTPVYIIEIEVETNETSSEKKDEINIVDFNDKLQLSSIEKEKVILISDNDRDIYKEKYNIDYNEDNIFTVIHNVYEHFAKQLSDLKILVLFSDQNIKAFRNIYTDFRQITLNLYGNIDRKKLTDLYPIFMFGILPSKTYYLKYIYFYNSDRYLYSKISYKINRYEIIDTKTIDKNLKLDFTPGK
jgi:hypothetical protein